MAFYTYRIYCNDCAEHKEIDANSKPTECPVDSEHFVDQNKTAIIDNRSDRVSILNEILLSAEQETQWPRLLDALDKYSSFIAALDNYNYTLARSRIAKAKDAEDITQADYDLIDSKMPV